MSGSPQEVIISFLRSSGKLPFLPERMNSAIRIFLVIPRNSWADLSFQSMTSKRMLSAPVEMPSAESTEFGTRAKKVSFQRGFGLAKREAGKLLSFVHPGYP